MKGRVLVVDDDTALAEMLGIVLRGEGFEPSFVADGDKALAAFREAKPDLVLLDLMLPGRDGIEVCRLIRAESGVPIVSVSLGDVARFVIGGLTRREPTRPLMLHSGDVLVMGGASRLRFHGVTRVLPGTAPEGTGPGRFNLTFRQY